MNIWITVFEYMAKSSACHFCLPENDVDDFSGSVIQVASETIHVRTTKKSWNSSCDDVIFER